MTDKIKTQYSQSEKVGALIGYLVKTDGQRISSAKYNRLAKSFSLNRLKKDTLHKRVEQLAYDAESKSPTPMYKVFEAVKEGKLELYDVFGTTNDVEKFNEYVSYRQAPGIVANERLKQSQKEFKALQKDGVLFQMLTDDVYADLRDDIREGMPPLDIPKVEIVHGDKALLINAADWHLGNQFKASAPGITNEYNLEVFEQRWYEFLEYNIELAKRESIEKVYLIHLGDIVEGEYMRPSQGYFTELNFSQQVVRAMKEMRTTLLKLVEAGFDVSTGMILGNHDRIFNKKDNLYGDGVTRMITEYIRMLIESGQLPNVTLLDNSEDIHDLNIDIVGQNCFFTHGEKIKRNSAPDFSGIYGRGKAIDNLFYGHYHDFLVKAGNGGSLVVGCPANLGWNDYSKSLATNNSAAGQLSVIMERGKTPRLLPYFFK